MSNFIGFCWYLYLDDSVPLTLIFLLGQLFKRGLPNLQLLDWPGVVLPACYMDADSCNFCGFP